MNEIVLFSLIILIIIRVLGILLSSDFYYRNFDYKYLYFILGWILSLIGTFLPVIAELIEDNSLKSFIYFANILFITIGIYLLVVGVFFYFREIKFIKILLIGLILGGIPLLLYFISPFIARILIFYIFQTISSVFFLIHIIERKKFKTNAMESVKWYYLSTIIFFVFIPIYNIFIGGRGHSYGLYDTDDLLSIFINYTYVIGVLILMLILLIHLESTVNKNKNDKLKDKYSHELGNVLQSIMTSIDILLTSESLDKELMRIVEISQNKCKRAGEIIREIRKL